MMASGSGQARTTHAQIDPTSACDLNCVFCVGRDWVQAHLPAALFDQVLAELPDLVYVQLQGEGEPMLSKRFWSYLEALRARRIDVGIITNGRHLTVDAVQRLIDSGIRTVTVSIDSLDPERYRRLRLADVSVALRGLETLARLRSETMDVFIASVLTSETFGDFPGIIQLSERIGLTPPSCQELQRKESYTAHYRDGISIAEHGLSDEQQDWMRSYQSGRTEYRAKAGLMSFWESVVASDRTARCPFVKHSLHVRFDGHVFPCCFVKEEEFSLGQLPAEGPASPAVAAARQAMADSLERGDTPPPCVGCHVLGVHSH